MKSLGQRMNLSDHALEILYRKSRLDQGIAVLPFLIFAMGQHFTDAHLRAEAGLDTLDLGRGPIHPETSRQIQLAVERDLRLRNVFAAYKAEADLRAQPGGDAIADREVGCS